MPEDFDPYYRWLGISLEEQPPSHYRLLGVKPFEADAEVINNAADRQMSYVRTFQMSGRGKFAEEILSEITAAKVCLLSEPQKAEYDLRLKEALDAAQLVSGRATSEDTGPMTAPPDAPVEAPPPQIAVNVSSIKPGSHRVARDQPPKRSWQRTSTIAAITVVFVLLLINGAIWAYQRFFQDREVSAKSANAGDSVTPGIPAVALAEMPAGENLLAGLDLETATVRGEWIRDLDSTDGVTIVSDRTAYATIHLAQQLSNNYMLALAIRRISGGEALAITLPVGDARCSIVLNGGRNTSSGIELLRGAKFNDSDNPTTRPGRVLATDCNVIVHCHVTPESVRVECNGQTVIDWTGSAAHFAVPHYWDTPRKDGILLGTHRSAFRIENVVIVRGD
ncbi:MAG: hypothetical protein MPJ50_12195 [Pirellulales bacterium]|nr:hypothetical protein [Pirellulales bacterium]